MQKTCNTSTFLIPNLYNFHLYRTSENLPSPVLDPQKNKMYTQIAINNLCICFFKCARSYEMICYLYCKASCSNTMSYAFNSVAIMHTPSFALLCLVFSEK